MSLSEVVDGTAPAAAGPADLLARAQVGEREAFTALVERYHADLVRVAFAITGDLDTACDAAQLAWVTAWQRLPTIRQPDRLRAWLIAIAANQARQSLRAQRRRRVREIAVVDRGPADGHDTMVSTDRFDLQAALTRLGADDRALLAMRYLAGLTADEIGVATGMTGSGVRSRLSRLVARLREELNDE
jgi:RNA polymerase sigma-70 factor (ECF subfamily)